MKTVITTLIAITSGLAGIANAQDSFNFTGLETGVTSFTSEFGDVTADFTVTTNFTLDTSFQFSIGGANTMFGLRGGIGDNLPATTQVREILMTFSQPIIFSSGNTALGIDSHSYTFELLGGGVWSTFVTTPSIDAENDYFPPSGVTTSIVNLALDITTDPTTGDEAFWTILGPITAIKIIQTEAEGRFTGENVNFQFGNFQAVPETSSALLVGLSALGFVLNRRRK